MPTTMPAAVDALLVDGALVTIRPVVAADRAALFELYQTTSAAAMRARFFTASPHVIADEVFRLTRPPGDDHIAVVAIDRGRVLGVGLWERTDPGSAEFALLVRDGLHGHGVGTLLIEHLLTAARAAGIHRVTATVLADNSAMLRVLSNLGAVRRTRVESGVVDVDIALHDTPEWQRAVASRESRAEHASLHRILAPRGIAVVGAGRRATSPGHRILASLVGGGYRGHLYAVNLTGTPVLGVAAAHSVTACPEQVDLAVIAVPAAAVPGVVADCAAAGVYGVVVISDGFAESGSGGAERQAALQRLVREAGMRLVGPNCLGLVSTATDCPVYATFAEVRPPSGSVGLVSQSGGVGLALLDYVTRHNIGVSSFVSVGNKADVSGNDLLMYWQHDAATKVCALYLESFGNARKFARVARRVAREKPVVAVTAGRSVAGARGTRSHTAAASTPDVAIDTLFRQAGVIRASSLGEMLDVVALLDRAPLPAGRRVAVVSNSGGPAALATDACAASGLELPELSAATQAALDAQLRRPAATSNPVDTTAEATPNELAAVCRTLLASDDVDSVVLVHTSLGEGDADEVARELRKIRATDATKPLLSVFLGRAEAPPALSEGGRIVLPWFAFPEAAAMALGSVARYAEWRAQPEQRPEAVPDVQAERAREIVSTGLAGAPDGGCWLDTDAALELLAAYGVPVVGSRTAHTLDEAVAAAAAQGYPVVVKTAAGSIVHRTDVGGVRVGLRSGREVRAAVRDIRQRCGAHTPVVVQPMAAAGVETAVGMVVDKTIGPMVMVALGGVATDLLADRAFRLVPVGRSEAATQVRSLRAAPLLFGYRGSPRCDVAALEDIIVRVSKLAEDLPEVVELDLNPVLVRPDGAVAVDAKVRVARVREPDPYQRRLSIVERLPD